MKFNGTVADRSLRETVRKPKMRPNNTQYVAKARTQKSDIMWLLKPEIDFSDSLTGRGDPVIRKRWKIHIHTERHRGTFLPAFTQTDRD